MKRLNKAPAHGVCAPGANRSDAGQAVAGYHPPLPFTGQGQLALRLCPWPVNLQEPTRTVTLSFRRILPSSLLSRFMLIEEKE